MGIFFVIIPISILILTIVLHFMFRSKTIRNIHGYHIVVTGGSSGIGKSVALYVASKGANVTLLARNQERLQNVADEVQKCFIDEQQKVVTASVDLSKSYQDVENTMKKVIEDQGKEVDILVNCAGTSMSADFEKTSIDDFKYMMDVNYFASVYATKSVIGSMKARKEGSIVFISSQAGQLSFYGYTAYSSSKFALKGLSEALQSELKPYNVGITLAFPPDTDTPGFAEEQKSKPKETELISETGGLISSEIVAKKIVDDVLKGKFQCSFGVDGFLLATVSAGMAPVSSGLEALLQVFSMGLFRLIGLFYLYSFNQIIQKCYNEKKGNKKAS
ncbi:3-ketodihydrosphingosine reductase [Octopus vulgaris]|uniref:3-ketodihydrosphingosine reductase n=2 Tax=Octopus TaxID=6643 RepID=A0AA36AI14_OCTVU|nr:3-ketodihydrosphingosine reductase isoform X1 [Octopus sinensis]CAI9715888.1 3-ketodihydrosphingosine reductase [Octopus vulgaris]